MQTNHADTATAEPASSGIRWSIFFFLALLLTVYAMLFVVFVPDIWRFIEHIWLFAPIGVFGAIIANSTGTGGGVVFVPAFNSLSGASQAGTIPMEIAIDPVNIIAISFLIQCFGMSVGSSVWISRFFGGGKVHPTEKVDAHSFITIVFTVLVTTIPSLLLTQYFLFASVDGSLLITAFKWFSLVLGIVLLIFTWAFQHVRPHRFTADFTDTYWLLILGAIGGAVTAFFSVGVGEFVAVYLIFRKFPTLAAIAAAVVISAITVVAGVGYHVSNDNIIWPIALTAIPGAIIGGFLARIFAIALGPLWLKTFASLWIIVSSAFLIIGPWLGLIRG